MSDDTLNAVDAAAQSPFVLEPGEFVFDSEDNVWYQVQHATEVHERTTVLAVAEPGAAPLKVDELKKYRNSTKVEAASELEGVTIPSREDIEDVDVGSEINDQFDSRWNDVDAPEESIRALRVGNFYYHPEDDQWYEITHLALVKNTMVAAVTIPDSDTGVVELRAHHDSNAYPALTSDFENPIEVIR